MAITMAQKTRLGVFVVIGMVILAAFAVVPIVMQMSHRTVTYVSFFENESLVGLEQGAAVRFNGVNIGRVERVEFYPEDIGKMKVTMSVADNFPMRVDMHATTGLIGITGLKYVEISGGSNEAARLPPGGVVPTRRTFFATIGEQIEEFVGKIGTLFDQLNAVTNPDSLHSIKIAIDNLAELTGEAKHLFADVRTAMPSAKAAVDTALVAVNNVAEVTRNIVEITERFRLGVETGNVSGLFAQVDSTITSVNTLTSNLTMTVMQTREDFSVTMENLRDATESANQLLRMLAENPSLLIRGDVRERDRR